MRSLYEVSGEFPAERVRFVAIPVGDEASHRGLELPRVAEAAESQHAPLEDGEPYLDLVDPGRVQGRVHELETVAVARVELGPTLVQAVLVNVEVVPDDDNPSLGVTACDPRHELQHRGGVPVLHDLADHLAPAYLKGSEQRTRAVTNVLELAPQAAITHAPRRIPSGERLHGLLVDAKDDRVLRRVQVELADAPDLRSKVGIGAVQP